MPYLYMIYMIKTEMFLSTAPSRRTSAAASSSARRREYPSAGARRVSALAGDGFTVRARVRDAALICFSSTVSACQSYRNVGAERPLNDLFIVCVARRRSPPAPGARSWRRAPAGARSRGSFRSASP